MTAEQADTTGEWRVEATGGSPERPQAVVVGPGPRFTLLRKDDAEALAELLNAQTAALAEAARTANRYDCGKTTLQKAAMVPCLNLPKGDPCYACEIAKARYERNSFCICDDDDEFPTAPADYCPVHGDTYRYVLQEESRRVETSRALDDAMARAEAAAARAAHLEAALRSIAGMAAESGRDCSAVARDALGES